MNKWECNGAPHCCFIIATAPQWDRRHQPTKQQPRGQNVSLKSIVQLQKQPINMQSSGGVSSSVLLLLLSDVTGRRGGRGETRDLKCVCVCKKDWCAAGAPSLLTPTQLSGEPISHRWAQLWRPRRCRTFIYTQFLLSAFNEGARRRGREEGGRAETLLTSWFGLSARGRDLWGFCPKSVSENKDRQIQVGT